MKPKSTYTDEWREDLHFTAREALKMADVCLLGSKVEQMAAAAALLTAAKDTFSMLYFIEDREEAAERAKEAVERAKVRAEVSAANALADAEWREKMDLEPGE